MPVISNTHDISSSMRRDPQRLRRERADPDLVHDEHRGAA